MSDYEDDDFEAYEDDDFEARAALAGGAASQIHAYQQITAPPYLKLNVTQLSHVHSQEEEDEEEDQQQQHVQAATRSPPLAHGATKLQLGKQVHQQQAAEDVDHAGAPTAAFAHSFCSIRVVTSPCSHIAPPLQSIYPLQTRSGVAWCGTRLKTWQQRSHRCSSARDATGLQLHPPNCSALSCR
jgi:hypothetical protein